MTQEAVRSEMVANRPPAEAAIVRRCIGSDGKRVSYLTALGSGGGTHPAILLIHGAGVSARSWTHQLRGLGHALQVLAIDLPGHGESDPTPEMTLEGYAEAARGLLDALRTGPAFVAGHSLGGAVAQVLAARHTEMVKGLILLSTCVKLPPSGGFLKRAYWYLPAPFRRALFFSMAKKVLFAPSAPRDTILVGMEEIRTCRSETILTDVAVAQAMDLEEVARALRVPSLILCGKRDKLTPPALSEALRELIPGSRLLILEEAGHMLPLEAGERVNQELLDFVSSVMGRGIPRLPCLGRIIKRSALRRLVEHTKALLRREWPG